MLYTIDENPTFYEGQAEVVAADFAALGGEIVGEIAVTAETDYAALMSEIEAAAPDQLFCACEPEAASALLTALAESDLSTIPLLGAELNWADQLLDLIGADAEGVYVISGKSEPSEASAALAARYEERFGDAPHSPYYSNAYDAYQLLLDAVLAIAVLEENGGRCALTAPPSKPKSATRAITSASPAPSVCRRNVANACARRMPACTVKSKMVL